MHARRAVDPARLRVDPPDLLGERIRTPIRTHRLDLQGGITKTPLGAAHRGDPVPPQLDQLVAALPSHTPDHLGHPVTTPHGLWYGTVSMPSTRPGNPSFRTIRRPQAVGKGRAVPARGAALCPQDARFHTSRCSLCRPCQARARQRGEQYAAETGRSISAVQDVPHSGQPADVRPGQAPPPAPAYPARLTLHQPPTAGYEILGRLKSLTRPDGRTLPDAADAAPVNPWCAVPRGESSRWAAASSPRWCRQSWWRRRRWWSPRWVSGRVLPVDFQDGRLPGPARPERRG